MRAVQLMDHELSVQISHPHLSFSKGKYENKYEFQNVKYIFINYLYPMLILNFSIFVPKY